jgi:hypothetical protein
MTWRDRPASSLLLPPPPCHVGWHRTGSVLALPFWRTGARHRERTMVQSRRAQTVPRLWNLEFRERRT